jgi:glycerophosphoryl diester phosphodiesterase
MGRRMRVLGTVALGVGAAAAYGYLSWRPRKLDYLYDGRRLVLGHRGAAAEAPANTAQAFRRAMEAGADGVELDVHLTRDGQVVVVHDDAVTLAPGVTAVVRALTLAQVREVDAGDGERIPTLDEALEAAGPEAIVNIELKGASATTEGLERAAVRTVYAHGMSRRVIVSSFNPFRLWRVGRLDPELPRAMLHGPGTPVFVRDLWFLPLVQPDALHPHYSLVDEAYMARARRWGVRVNAWTVNDPAEVQRLLDLGVDGVITDDPRGMREVVAA